MPDAPNPSARASSPQALIYMGFQSARFTQLRYY